MNYAPKYLGLPYLCSDALQQGKFTYHEHRPEITVVIYHVICLKERMPLLSFTPVKRYELFNIDFACIAANYLF